MGLVPAAGRGTRVSPLPCSKELFPVGFRSDAEDDRPRPKVAAHHLLEKMARTGAGRAFVVLRDGKWDIPSYFGEVTGLGLELAYVMMRRPFGVPFSVDDARPFVADATVLFGFPDILFRPDDVFVRLVERLDGGDGDVVVAVFPRRGASGADGIELDGDGRIQSWDRTAEEDHPYTWIAAVWKPSVTEFLHEFVVAEEPSVRANNGSWRDQEMVMGDVFHEGMRRGLQVEPLVFDHGQFVDIGTPSDLAAAVRTFAGED